MATDDVVRQNALARIDAVQVLVHALPTGSPIAAVLTDAYLQEQRMRAGDEADLESAEWPPLLGWTVAPWRADEIALLDGDIQMVRDHPTSSPVQGRLTPRTPGAPAGQPSMGAVKQMPPGSSLPDISLMTFLRRQWPTTAANLLESPARLSGALIFNCLGLQGGRINYNANADQQVSHLEMMFLERVFAPARGWESLQQPTSAGTPEESANTTSATR